MSLKNTEDTYGWVAKFLHWVIGFTMIALLAVGTYMEGLKASDFKWTLYLTHKSIGVAILLLILWRIIWTIYNKAPRLPEGMDKKLVLASKLTHLALYVVMIGMPLSGWLMSSAGGYPVSFFKLFTIPPLMDKNPDLGKIFHLIHEIMGKAAIALIVIHVLAALKHHIIDKDNILTRMLPFGGKCLLTGDECITKKLKPKPKSDKTD